MCSSDLLQAPASQNNFTAKIMATTTKTAFNCSICTEHIYLTNLHNTKTEFVPFYNYDDKKRLFPSEVDPIHLVVLEYSLQPDFDCIHDCLPNVIDKSNDGLILCVSYMADKNWNWLEKFCRGGKARIVLIQNHA